MAVEMESAQAVTEDQVVADEEISAPTTPEAGQPEMVDGPGERCDAVSEMLDRAEVRCGEADQIVGRLEGVLDGLADAGEASQDRISLLLDSVEAGTQAREDLLRVISKATEIRSNVSSELADHAKKLQNAADEKLGELAAKHDRLLEGSVAKFGENVAAGRHRVEEWAGQERSRFDARSSQINKMMDRASTLAEEGVARVQDSAIKRVEKWEETVARDRERMDAITREAENRLAAMVDQKLAEVGASLATRLEGMIEKSLGEVVQVIADIRDRAISKVSGLGDDGVERVQAVADKATSRIDERMPEFEKQGRLVEDSGQKITQLATRETARLEQLAGVKMDELTRQSAAKSQQAEAMFAEHQKRLASQIQAGGETVRMLSDATQKGSDALGEQRKQQVVVFDQLKQLQSSSEIAKSSNRALKETLAKTTPAEMALKEALDGSRLAIEKIECTIQDVWTLTTTAQERTRQLSERTKRADETVGQLESFREEAEAVSGKLANHDATAKRRIDDITRLLGESEGVVVRADAAVERLTMIVKQAEAGHNKLTQAMPLADETTSHIVHTIESAEKVRRRVADEQVSAQKQLDQLEKVRIANHDVATSLDESVRAGQSASQTLNQQMVRSSKLIETVSAVTQEANEAGREVSQLLANVLERAEMLDASDERLSGFLEHLGDVQSRMQQIETRTESFTHQLNSMMADPQRVINDAKTQAVQLDKVCRAVRKVFSGLSQASLQANRDVTRFAEVSREANGRLSQLSAETSKSSQTLREWVDEAKHVQTRLSKTLARVPAITQTHSPVALEGLADASREALPGVLKPLSGGRMRDGRRFSKSSVTSEKTEPVSRNVDFGEWILEAEEMGSSTGK